MNPRNRRFLARVGFGVLILAGIAAPLHVAGYRWNETASLPPGLWRLTDAPLGDLRGRIVFFCPPNTPVMHEARDRGYLNDGPCPGRLEPLFKPIVAVAGDRVTIGAEGVRVNGAALLHNSAPAAADGVGRELPQIPAGDYTVAEGEAWAVSGYTALSFDSRYFGPIQIDSIDGEALPVWVDGAVP